MLRKHYDKVGRSFDHLVGDDLPDDLAPTEVERAEIRATLDRLFDEQTKESAEIVMDNTQSGVVSAVARAQRLIREDEGLSDADLPTLASNLFLAKQGGRATILGRCSTQWAAEISKSVEVSVLLGEPSAGIKASAQGIKVWRSQGDSRVRTTPFDHLSADGQRVPTDFSFTVGGQSLMFPGDRALGATSENVLGCRCSAIYDVPSIAALRRIIGETLVPDLVEPFALTESEVVTGVTFGEGGVVADIVQDIDTGDIISIPGLPKD
jgi:hypothetical protein